MNSDGASPGRHQDLVKRQADLAAIHESLDLIESELLAKEVRSKLDRSRFLREQLAAVREGGRSR
jgi:hypothetical protein